MCVQVKLIKPKYEIYDEQNTVKQQGIKIKCEYKSKYDDVLTFNKKEVHKKC